MMVSCLICIQCSSPLSAEILAALSISSPVRFSSELLITLRTAILRSFKEWPELLKWPATGFSVHLCVISLRHSMRQMWRVFSVSPMYCFQYFLHSIE